MNSKYASEMQGEALKTRSNARTKKTNWRNENEAPNTKRKRNQPRFSFFVFIFCVRSRFSFAVARSNGTSRSSFRDIVVFVNIAGGTDDRGCGRRWQTNLSRNSEVRTNRPRDLACHLSVQSFMRAWCDELRFVSVLRADEDPGSRPRSSFTRVAVPVVLDSDYLPESCEPDEMIKPESCWLHLVPP